MILQTKCGIRKDSFDFSKEHILEAVDGSLKRLRTEYIDVLLLHRPDALGGARRGRRGVHDPGNQRQGQIFRGQKTRSDADRIAM